MTYIDTCIDSNIIGPIHFETLHRIMCWDEKPRNVIVLVLSVEAVLSVSTKRSVFKGHNSKSLSRYSIK